MDTKQKISIFWFRYHLRLFDKTGLNQAYKGSLSVLPLFISDTKFPDRLPNKQEARLNFVSEKWETPACPGPMPGLKESRAESIATCKKHLNG